MKAIDKAKFDTCTQLNGAEIQFGPNSSRVYLMSMGSASPSAMPEALLQLAEEQHLGKIIAKVRQSDAEAFFTRGFVEEASLPGYYGAKGIGIDEDALMLAAYPDAERQRDSKEAENDKILKQAIANLKPFRPSHEWQIIKLNPAYVNEMAHLYREVFPSYPFPILNPDYLRRSMAQNVTYFGIKHQCRLVALASAERDSKNQAVEMTDFATLPQYQGKQLAAMLLSAMETQMRDEGYRQAFTIARAASLGMNRTFARQGYQFQGRLVNNTQISGQIESMNVWSKALNPGR